MQCARLSVRQIQRSRLSSLNPPRGRYIRAFRTSSCFNEPPSTPTGAVEPDAGEPSLDNGNVASNAESKDHKLAPEEKAVRLNRDADTKKPPNKNLGPYGSALRRAMRNRRSQESASPTGLIPSWFQERNILFPNASAHESQFLEHSVGIGQHPETEESVQGTTQGGDGGDDKGPSGGPAVEHRYVISQEIWDEIRASVDAALTLPALRYANDPAVTKAHLVLQYPAEGGIPFLDSVVKKVASSLDVNVITLNAQDISELYHEQENDGDVSSQMMASLGYDVFHSAKSTRLEEEAEDKGDEELPEDEESDEWGSRGASARLRPQSGTTPGSSFLQSLFGGRASIGVAKVVFPSTRGRKEDIEEESDARSIRLVNGLLSAPKVQPAEPSKVKGASESVEATSPPSSLDQPSLEDKYQDLVIQIQDYNGLASSQGGAMFLSALHKAVQSRRRKGQRVVVIGTVSAAEADKHTIRKAFPKTTQRDHDEYSTTIIVTPAMDSQKVEEIFSEDLKRRILDINIRHLQRMLKTRLQDRPSKHSILSSRAWPLNSDTVRISGLDSIYWPFDLVHRVVTLAIGHSKGVENLEPQHIQQAIDLFAKSDRVKAEWLGAKYPGIKISKDGQEESRVQKLRGKCNTHEQRLLNGVVDASSIRTTFADVHVPKDTVDALKTLTSLSLIRPEAFTYGVLSTDKIPGLLLYGPPGTGKTLLAKAVARESGATVLEVSGSEVYDMYVGEGEKNVKAIFSLAKKLSPCIVFIDEADAIFCSRTGASNRTSHRELINQFLREWDGMNDTSAFIMVATNRPFDLDDAVLRRLPRRLLVDLPTEKDRLEILKIHLKEERLDPSVDLADIVRRTPFYSGSDLKNMSVAAALACVRDENDAAARHEGSEPYKYPERRTLLPHHFDRAMEEISASISEDMSSLIAIRKFDEKYGDRKGRRKKPAGLGFSSPGDVQTSLETGRVRN